MAKQVMKKAKDEQETATKAAAAAASASASKAEKNAPSSAPSSTTTALAPSKTSGWLYKKGGSRGGRHNWLRRFFKIEGAVALYFESDKDGRPKGMIELRDSIMV